MYKTAVNTPANGVIVHQKQQISKKWYLRSMALPKCQWRDSAIRLTFRTTKLKVNTDSPRDNRKF